MPKPIKNSSRYMPGLDGLRAIAVLAVIAYHLNLDWVPGGLLGVTMFFVLSGYLITDILLKQLGQNKQLDLKTFFIRRARRLLPAMFAMIALVSIWLWISDAGRLLSLRGDIGSALLYISNWWLIFHKVSYFESFGPPSPFGHLWSLAVEEQFYLLWPLLLALIVRFVPKRGKLALWTLGAAALSAAAMAVLYQPGADPSRIYYGTDTRAFALLIGAALAIVWPSWKLKETISARSRFSLDAIGTIGLAIILVMINRTGEYSSFLYQGGMVLLAIATAVVVAALAHPASRLSRIIGSKVLTWIGVRSYGIYLYHYPIIVLTTPTAEIGEFQPVRVMIQIALTFILAELSWRFVEEPIRHGKLDKAAGMIKRQFMHQMRKPRMVKNISYFAAMVLIFSVMFFVNGENLQSANRDDNDITAVAPGPSNENVAPPKDETQGTTGQEGNGNEKEPVDKEQQKPPAPTEQPDKEAQPSDQGSKKPDESPTDGSKNPDFEETETVTPPPATEEPVKDKPVTTVPPQENVTPEPTPTSKPSTPILQGGISVIGDSVILNATPYLEEALPGIIVDGKVGRQLSQALEVIEEMKKNNKLGGTVILQLGTNGAFTTKQMDKLLDAIGTERHIFLVNARVPRKWQDTVNKMLAETAANAENVTLIDWYTKSKGKEDFFNHDGVHLKTTGAKFYADMLIEAINKS